MKIVRRLVLSKKSGKEAKKSKLNVKTERKDALKPIINVPTRCESSYDLLERLLVLKLITLDFVTFNEDIELMQDELMIEHLKKDMEVTRNATIRLQNRLMTAGALFLIGN